MKPGRLNSTRIAQLAGLGLILLDPIIPLGAQSPTRADVSYIAGGTPAQTLDLYAPAGSRGFATLIMVHGGGLTTGDKREFELPAICATIARAGAGCVAVNYRLGPFPKWPSQPDVVAAAVAWVRHHVAEFGGDSGKLVVLGHSSGCTIASIPGTDPKYLASAGLTLAALSGVIDMGCTLSPVLPAVADSVRLRGYFVGTAALGTFGSLETFLDVNPTAHVTVQTPPTLVLMADSEQVEPPIRERARPFEARMRTAGRPVDVVIVPDRRHMPALTSMQNPDDPALAIVLAFIQRATRGHSGS